MEIRKKTYNLPRGGQMRYNFKIALNYWYTLRKNNMFFITPQANLLYQIKQMRPMQFNANSFQRYSMPKEHTNNNKFDNYEFDNKKFVAKQQHFCNQTYGENKMAFIYNIAIWFV